MKKGTQKGSNCPKHLDGGKTTGTKKQCSKCPKSLTMCPKHFASASKKRACVLPTHNDIGCSSAHVVTTQSRRRSVFQAAELFAVVRALVKLRNVLPVQWCVSVKGSSLRSKA
eukprot:4392163-Amphidinium_carterae.2